MPLVDGDPESTPEPNSDRRGGIVPPDMLQLYGAMPPVALITWLYADPTFPSASGEVVVIDRPVTLMENCLEELALAESIT